MLFVLILLKIRRGCIRWGIKMTLLEIFRFNLRYYRYQQNYSQEKLAEKSGLSTHYISDIELGRYSPSIPIIEALAQALKIEPDLLFIYSSSVKDMSARIDIHRVKNKKSS